MPKIPTDTRSVNPNLVVGYRTPKSYVKAEKYAFKAAEKGHERQMQQFENDRIARTINFVGNLTQTAIDFTDKLIQNEAARQLSNAEVIVDQEFNNVKTDLANNPYEQKDVIGAEGIGPGTPKAEAQPQRWILRHDKVWGEAKQKIKDEVLKTLTNPRAKKLFEMRYEGVANNFGRELQNDARTIMRNQQKVDSNNNIEYWVSKGRMDKVNELLAAGRATGLYKPEEIDTIADNARTAIGYVNAKKEAVNRYNIGGFDAAHSYLMSNETPENLTTVNRDRIIKEIKTEDEYIKAQREDAETRQTEQLMNDFTMRYTKPDNDVKTLQGLREDVRQSALPYDKKASFIKKIDTDVESLLGGEKDKSKWEITDPDTEAKVVDYIRNPDYSKEQKAALIKKYHGKGLSTDDTNKYYGQIGWPESEKTPGKVESDNNTLKQLQPLITDPTVHESTKRNALNDALIKGTLSPTDYRTLESRSRVTSDSPAEKIAYDKADAAYNAKWIDDKQMIDFKQAILKKISTTDYTEEGIRQLADNMLMQMSDKYADAIMEESGLPWNPFWWGKEREQEAIQKYIAEHPPEKKQTQSGSIDDFIIMTGVNKEDVKTVKDTSGNQVFQAKGNYFEFINGTWHVLQNNKWIPVR